MPGGTPIDTTRVTKLWENGLLDAQIAKEVNCTEKAISN